MQALRWQRWAGAPEIVSDSFIVVHHGPDRGRILPSLLHRGLTQSQPQITDDLVHGRFHLPQAVLPRMRRRRPCATQVLRRARRFRFRVLPPIGKQQRYPALDLTVIHVRERDKPADRPRIDWRLITDLRVEQPEDAVEKLTWYSMRWKIEVFHKILKSGCRAEDARLRTAERLVNLIAVICVLSWRLFWMTMMNRVTPDAPASLALAPGEISLLDRLAEHSPVPGAGRSLSAYLDQLARLGGYLGRTRDPPPGNIVMWRGWSRFMDISLGATCSEQLVGNQ